MKKLFKFLSSRLFWVVLLFSCQLALIIFFVFWTSFSKGDYLIFILLSIVIAVVIMTRKEKAPYKLVWMFLLVIFPFFGAVFYVLFANKKIGRLGRKRLKKFFKKVNEMPLSLEDSKEEELYLLSPVFKREAEYIINSTGQRVWRNTEAIYFSEGQDFFFDLIKELEKAERFIFIEYFIIGKGIWWDRILSILSDKVKKGVDIRVIYDDMGSIDSLPIDTPKTLRRLGIKTLVFNKVRLHINPRLNFRDHRKILSIDGNICYTGGLNLADEYSNDKIRFGYWKDNAVKIIGLGVWNLTYLFLLNWCSNTGILEDFNNFIPTKEAKNDGFVQAFGDNPLDTTNIAENVYLQMINNAKNYIWITTPYLIPDDTIKEALQIAAKSNVEVKIIVPHYPDKKSVFEVTRSNYLDLVKEGVEIYEYTPGFIHSKTFLVDDEICCLGTTNIDYRSFYLHFELSVMFYNSSIIKKVKDDFLHTLDLSKRVTKESIENLPLYTKATQMVLKLFSPAL